MMYSAMAAMIAVEYSLLWFSKKATKLIEYYTLGGMYTFKGDSGGLEGGRDEVLQGVEKGEKAKVRGNREQARDESDEAEPYAHKDTQRKKGYQFNWSDTDLWCNGCAGIGGSRHTVRTVSGWWVPGGPLRQDLEPKGGWRTENRSPRRNQTLK